MLRTRFSFVLINAVFYGCVVLSAVLVAQPEKTIVLAPEYACSGVLHGKSYTLVLTVKPFGDGYALSWVAERQELFTGFGIRNGNHLAVISQDKKSNTVLAAYLIEPGTLNGRWMAGDGEMHTEICLVGKPA